MVFVGCPGAQREAVRPSVRTFASPPVAPFADERTSVIYSLLKYVVLGPLLRLIFRPRVEGRSNVPVSGAAILASNHLSFCDSIFLPLMVRRRVTFVAKAEYFTGSGVKGRLIRLFFESTGTIPIDRSGGQAARVAMDTGLAILRAGGLFGIYPEGTRSPDGRLYRGKTGVARLALEARAPVVPTAMIGGFEFQPPGRLAPRLHVRPGVRFGKPLDFSRYYGLEQDQIVLRAMTDEIMYEVMRLSGQEYVDEYAQDAKARAKGKLTAVGHHVDDEPHSAADRVGL